MHFEGNMINDIILEVGYNHLGSEKLFLNYAKIAAANANSITFQYRSTGVEQSLKLGLGIVLEGLEIVCSVFPNCRIGLAVDSLDGFEAAVTNFDFCKVLSVSSNSDWCIDALNKYSEFPTYFSLGLTNINQLSQLHPLFTNPKFSFPIYTSFLKDGSDISHYEISELFRRFNRVCYGHHQSSTSSLIASLGAFDFQHVFIYLTLFSEKQYNPDSCHSLDVRELDYVKSFCQKTQAMRSQDPRSSYAQFSG